MSQSSDNALGSKGDDMADRSGGVTDYRQSFDRVPQALSRATRATEPLIRIAAGRVLRRIRWRGDDAIEAAATLEELRRFWQTEIEQDNFLPPLELRDRLIAMLNSFDKSNQQRSEPSIALAIQHLDEAALDQTLAREQIRAIESARKLLKAQPAYDDTILPAGLELLPPDLLSVVVTALFARLRDETFTDFHGEMGFENLLVPLNELRGRFVPEIEALFAIYLTFSGLVLAQWLNWLAEHEGRDPGWVRYSHLMISWQLASVASWVGLSALLKFLDRTLHEEDARHHFIALTFAELVIRIGHAGGWLREYGGGSIASDVIAPEPKSRESPFIQPAAADGELRIGDPTSERRDVDERRVHAVILQGGRKRRAFVTGADNVIRCWIGLPEGDAAADKSIPAVSIPPEGLPLLVQLYWRDGSGSDHTDSKPMLLPAERTARSGDCDLHVFVPEGERYVSVEIMFRYRGRAFEMVRVESDALAPDEVEAPKHGILVRVQASRREVIELPDSQFVGATFVFGDDRPGSRQDGSSAASSSLRAFGREGATNFDLSDASEAIRWLNEKLSVTEKLVMRRRAVPGPVGTVGVSAPLPQDVLDPDDQDVCGLLRDMARHGADLYNKLAAKRFDDPGERIQVLNHEPNTYVPLEFIYDRGFPVSNAKVCAAGVEALRSDTDACPVCTVPTPEEERASAPVICPFGFWSIRKVIERVALGVSGKASTPRAERRGLPVLDSVAFASSHRVPQEERKATQEALRHSFGRVFLAEDWSQWREAMKECPSLLLLMPHHGIQDKLDYLEIGDEQLPENLGKLSRAQLLRQYVNVDDRDPGPMVLLLGCQTAARTETGYVQITHLIQEQHASIVLGTLAEILGRHAAPLARELVAELVAIKDPQTDFGTVMRRVRRRMLARGYLMALCLVALGDAEWRLTPRPNFGQR